MLFEKSISITIGLYRTPCSLSLRALVGAIGTTLTDTGTSRMLDAERLHTTTPRVQHLDAASRLDRSLHFFQGCIRLSQGRVFAVAAQHVPREHDVDAALEHALRASE